MDRRTFLAASLAAPFAKAGQAKPAVSRLLYVVCPGIRDYLEFGGAGILVFDIDKGHAFVERIVTTASANAKPANIKGVCASAETGKLYFTTPKKLYAVDLHTSKTLWDRALPEGCDRMAITPNGMPAMTASEAQVCLNPWNVMRSSSRAFRQAAFMGSRC